MKIGLEAIGFDIPEHYIDMVDLAKARNTDPDKYTIGIGQKEMSVASPCEDSVVLAGEAGLTLLKDFDVDPKSIALLLVGTESGVDNSKSIASYIHQLLGVSPECRTFEIKQACYGGMGGLAMANNFISSGKAKGKKALVIASDVARYGINTVGEPTQGAGAVAMLISDQPNLIEFDTQNDGYFSSQVMDFWRPLYSKEPVVDGQYSQQCYLSALEGAYNHYKRNILNSGSVDSLEDFNARFIACLYHAPFVKMVQKAHQKLLEIDAGKAFEKESPEALAAKKDFQKRTAPFLELNGRVGNIYTASLFLSLVNFLEASNQDAIGQQISLFSYGSGCTAEFMTAVVSEGASRLKQKRNFKQILEKRKRVTVEGYEELMNACAKMDVNDETVCQPEKWGLKKSVLYLGTHNHKRIYSLNGKEIS